VSANVAPRFSICVTTYQAGKTVRASFESLLPQLDSRFEVVAVDSWSTDGTLDYLRQLEADGRIRLIIKKCTRGEGRQIAAENARGIVLVQQVDADQLYKPFLRDVAERYEAEAKKDPEVLLMLVSKEHVSIGERMASPISFVSKEAFFSKTRWSPLNYAEDLYLFDVFKREGHCVEVEADYATQMSEGLHRTLVRLVANKKEMLDSGFSFRSVLKKTRYHGLLFIVRALIVSLAWIWHKLEL
jgi:glycosyltransferase involved in cell wall biosynthesis